MSGFNKLTSSQIQRIYRAVEQTPLLEDFANKGTFADFVVSTWDIIMCRSIKTLQHILTAYMNRYCKCRLYPARFYVTDGFPVSLTPSI